VKNKFKFILTLLLGFYACNQPTNSIDIEEGDVTITGKIESYQGVYKTGKLTYFDAVTRNVQNKVFAIDSLGNFKLSFELLHPLLNSILFDVGGNYYSGFLVEPNTNYSITFKGIELLFNTKTGKENKTIIEFQNAINSVLKEKLSEANKLHEKGLSIDEYITFQKQLELDKTSFLNSYCEQNSISKKVKSVLQSEIKFNTAHAIINYRFDYSQGFPMSRKSLPETFYINLFNEYAVQSVVDFQSRACIDYIANIVSVLSHEVAKVDEKIIFFQSFSIFSQPEMEMLQKALSGDRTIAETEEFKEFIKSNEDKVSELNKRYSVHTLLNNIDLLGSSLTKDLVISQGVSKLYFENNMEPTAQEWEQIENNITNESIYNHLISKKANKRDVLKVNKDSNQQAIDESVEEVKFKYIDKYRGKVIYVDFYATWCGPCREEIPYANQLYQEFKNRDVVFLNLCAKSKADDWENLIKQHELKGENYLLTNEEYYLLSGIYGAEGFPTYILIDKNGDVSEYNAPRPSARKDLYEKINKLLQ